MNLRARIKSLEKKASRKSLTNDRDLELRVAGIPRSVAISRMMIRGFDFLEQNSLSDEQHDKLLQSIERCRDTLATEIENEACDVEEWPELGDSRLLKE